MQIVHVNYLEQAMVQKHLESDKILKWLLICLLITECIFIDIARESRNMFFLHNCSKFKSGLRGWMPRKYNSDTASTDNRELL